MDGEENYSRTAGNINYSRRIWPHVLNFSSRKSLCVLLPEIRCEYQKPGTPGSYSGTPSSYSGTQYPLTPLSIHFDWFKDINLLS